MLEEAIKNEKKNYRNLFSDYIALEKENGHLKKELENSVFIDIERGCYNCKHDLGSICEILNKGTHDYIKGASECGLKFWEINLKELKDE